jgi:hypothetical protein
MACQLCARGWLVPSVWSSTPRPRLVAAWVSKKGRGRAAGRLRNLNPLPPVTPRHRRPQPAARSPQPAATSSRHVGEGLCGL